MESKVIYRKDREFLAIEIKPKPKGIIKFGIWFFYVLPFMMAVFVGTYLLTREIDRIFRLEVDFLILLGAIIGSVLLIRIFLRRIHQKEIITVTDKLLILSKKLIFETKRQEFKKDEIFNLQYVGREDFTKHPLDPEGFDYIGLGTGEREVQFFIESGNLAFTYNESLIRFGKNIWEEEGLEIIEKIKKWR